MHSKLKAVLVRAHIPTGAGFACRHGSCRRLYHAYPETCPGTLHLDYTWNKCPYRQGICPRAAGFHGTPRVAAALRLLPVPALSCCGMSRTTPGPGSGPHQPWPFSEGQMSSLRGRGCWQAPEYPSRDRRDATSLALKRQSLRAKESL